MLRGRGMLMNRAVTCKWGAAAVGDGTAVTAPAAAVPTACIFLQARNDAILLGAQSRA